MIPFNQLINNDPENGQYGDCYRTCIASILEIEPEKVPHFYQTGEPGSLEKVRDWLYKYDCYLIDVAFRNNNIIELLRMLNSSYRNIYCIISGQSDRGYDHACVLYNGEIIHDPHPSKKGINRPCSTGYYHVEAIVKLPK